MRLTSPFSRFVMVFSLMLAVSACSKSSKPKDDPKTAVPKTAPAKPVLHPEVAEIPLSATAPDDPTRRPTAPAKKPERVAAIYILVQHQGAKNAEKALRSKDVAAKRTARLLKASRKKGIDFKELAKKFSDVPQEQRGQVLLFSAGQMEPAFEKAAFALEVGQVAEPVHTPFGYYVIMRVPPEEYSTAHILVQFKGAKSAPSGIKRTKKEAQERAETVAKRAGKGENFAVLAERYSDSPSRIRGGVIRPVVPGEMPKDYDAYIAAVRTLKVGGVSSVVETPFGFHVIRRLKLERIRASHVLIAHNGAEVDPSEPRTRPEAKRLASKLWRKAQKADTDFAGLAQKHSDDTSTATKGGDLGRFARGMMVPKIEQIAFALKVGQVSDVLETRFGYHVIKRTE